MTLLAPDETGEMAQILASHTGYVGGMDTDSWGGFFPSLFLTTVFPLLLHSFLVRRLATLGVRSVRARP